jgi:hypothetical protein
MLDPKILERARPAMNDEKVECCRAFTLGTCRLEIHQTQRLDDHANLFARLGREGVIQRFAVLNMTARKTPRIGVVGPILRPVGH